VSRTILPYPGHSSPPPTHVGFYAGLGRGGGGARQRSLGYAGWHGGGALTQRHDSVPLPITANFALRSPTMTCIGDAPRITQSLFKHMIYLQRVFLALFWTVLDGSPLVAWHFQRVFVYSMAFSPHPFFCIQRFMFAFQSSLTIPGSVCGSVSSAS
jgi:hypothetical protein